MSGALQLQKMDGGSYRSLIDPGEPGVEQPRLSVTDEEGRILALLAAGKVVLEIGTGLGVSTRYLSEAALKVITLDIDPWVREFVWPTLADLKNVTPEINLFAVEDRTADMVFIDGRHVEEAIRLDIDLALKFLVPGGMLVFHDTRYDHVRLAIAKVNVGPLFHCPTRHGIGVVWPWA